MSDEAEIRALIERWAEAVHTGDMDGVLAGHADDIVMFDVPPPEDGVRGIQAYRDTWPPFFEWQRQGAAFEIVSLKLSLATTSPSRTRCSVAEPPRSSAGPGQPPSADHRAAQGGRALGRGPRAPLVSEQEPGLARTLADGRLLRSLEAGKAPGRV